MAGTRRGRSVSFADDERGRVPFALIGVLLLVTSTAYAAGIVDQGLVSEDRSVERAVDRADADATAALRHAAREAAYDAAARPVTHAPSETGSADPAAAVRPATAFEDAFRIRLALAGIEALAAVNAEVEDVSATATLRGIDGPVDPADLETLRETVRVGSAANGTATRVVSENVTLTATRGGRTVAERTRTRSVVVSVPTLAAHERTERFERRLNRGPVEGPGLGRQLTASLYPMTWARGYGQYAGAPVQNVLANRHVELSTNAGIVRTQRDVFGTSDPDARGGLARATARTGLTDLLAPTKLDESAWSAAVLGAPTPTATAGGDGFAAARTHADETRPVSVGHAADVAAVAVHDDLESVVRESYRVEASLAADADRVAYGGRLRLPRPSAAGEGRWRRVDVRTRERVRVLPNSGAPSGTPAGPVDPHEALAFGAAARTVVVERSVRGRWKRTVERTFEIASAEGPPRIVTREVVVDSTTTEDSATDRYRVDVRVTGAYAPTDDAPDRPITTFGAAASADDPDLAGTPAAARAALGVDTAENVDRVARKAVVDGDVERSTVVFGQRSATTIDRIAADLDGLRVGVRAVETELSMEEMAVGAADPYGELAETLRNRRSDLVDAPRTYDGAADRGRAAARAAYLAAVVAELEAASADGKAATDGLLDRVEDAFGGPSVGDVIASREAARETERYPVGADGPGGAVTFVPNGSPGYLPRTAVDGATIDAVDGTTTRPLATRNLNYVTVPYGDVSGGIVDRILGTEDTVGIGVAGRVLLAADATLAERTDPDLRADRDALAGRVAASRMTVDRALVGALAARTSLSRGERRSVVAAVAAAYESPGERAVAIGDGTYADRVAARAARVDSLSAGDAGALAARLRVALRTAAGRDAVRVPTRFVDGPTEAVRGHVRGELEGVVEDGLRLAAENASERWAPSPVRRVGAGLPVAPVPGYWVATVNAWRVEVRGEYPRFALTADVGAPDRRFEYVREAATVTVSVGGERVRLGRTEPVRFESGTVVVVAVPAGPRGVGDVDGTRNETSAGW